MDELSLRVAAEVRAWMARRGVRQETLAAQMGLSQSALSMRLRGRTRWTINDLAAVSEALDVPMATLLAPRPETEPARNNRSSRSASTTPWTGAGQLLVLSFTRSLRAARPPGGHIQWNLFFHETSLRGGAELSAFHARRCSRHGGR